MDYKELLIKYIQLIKETEGIDYIDWINDAWNAIDFTDEEKAELEKLSKQYKP